MTGRPEFSHPIRADRVPTAGLEVALEADDIQRRALAERFAITAVNRLTAVVKLKPIRGGQLIRVTGHLSADVVQACVVTLDPVPEHVEEDFHVTFGPEVDDGEGEIDISVDDEDAPEPMTAGIIDIGEVVAEHLALGLEPFPRTAESKVPAAFAEAPSGVEKANPFAALAGLRQKKE